MKDTTIDEDIQEPMWLPARVPIVLLNGTIGIGYTLSSTIYPHNLNELIDATIKLIKHPERDVNLLPDSPTGCDIIIKDANTVIFQSSYVIDNVNYTITFLNTPYGNYIRSINNDLMEIQKSNNPIDEIIAADEESDFIKNKNAIKYIIRCKPCNLYKVVEKLFRRVPGFRISASGKNMTVVTPKFTTETLTASEILRLWIENRLIEKTAFLNRDLVAKTTKYNELLGKKFMLSPENLEKTIKVFRKCEEEEEIIPALVAFYKGKITTSQAKFVSGLRLSKLTNKEYIKTGEEIEKTKALIENIRETIKSPEKIRDSVIDELTEIKRKFGSPRRSKIINNVTNTTSVGVVQILTDGCVLFGETENPEHLSSDITPVTTDMVCLIDEKGKFIWIDTTRVEHNKLLTLTSIGKDKMGCCVAVISEEPMHDIIILTNKGKLKYISISKIPSNASRKPLLPLDDDERIVSIIETSENSNGNLLVYTSDGNGKKISIESLTKHNSVDALGQFIIKDTTNVSGMFILNDVKPLLMYVTKLGKIRVNNARFLSESKKYGDMKQIIKLSPRDDLIGVYCVTSDDVVVLSHADGRISSVSVKDLPVSTMAVEPSRPSHVPACEVIRAVIEADISI